MGGEWLRVSLVYFLAKPDFLAAPFLRYILTGGIAALVNIGVRVLLSRVMPFEAAVALAYIAGLITAYAPARMLVFPSSGTPLLLS